MNKESETRTIIKEIRNLFIFIFLGAIVILYANYLPIPYDFNKTITFIVITLMLIYATILLLAIVVGVLWDFLEKEL